MKKLQNYLRGMMFVGILAVFAFFIVGCASSSEGEETAVSSSPAAEYEDEPVEHEDEHEHEAEAGMLMLPELSAVELEGELLKVVASTNIIGDVVAQVGGEVIDLTVIIGPGQDPHSFQPAARDLTAVTNVHVIFLNGWDLEESLAHDLETIGEDVPIVAISANISPLTFGEDEHEHEEGAEHEEDAEHEHEHSGADPHVWFSIHNVEKWVENAEHVLSDLDPANAEIYADNAAAYLAELEALEEYVEAQLSQIPEDRRFLVTNHDSFSYFAHEYGFEVLGTVIPGASTLAEPSASDLAGLITEMEEHAVCAIFTETTVSDTLVQTVAAELNSCDEVAVVPLYTGSVGPVGSGADSYLSMFRANIDAVVAGLK